MPESNRYLPILLLLAVATIVPSAGSLSADPPSDDTWLLRYDFEPGEEVTYRVVSFDSITIWTAGVPRYMLRERAERMTYGCDTILPDGYGMWMRLDDVVVREKLDTLPWMMRSGHAWVGETIYFVMTPQGERLRLRDTLDRPGTLPGAPFQPTVLPHIGNQDSMSGGAGGVFDRKMWLLENSYPPSYWQGGVMRKMLGAGDTLGHTTAALQLNEVGQLWYLPPPVGDQHPLEIHTRLNGAGIYHFDFEAGYPVAGDYSMIANLAFNEDPEGRERIGRQIISMVFHIEEPGTSLHDLFEEDGSTRPNDED